MAKRGLKKAMIHGSAVEAKRDKASAGQRPRMRVISKERRDFEAEFACTIPVEAHVKRLTIPLALSEADKKKNPKATPPRVRGVFCTVKYVRGKKVVERHLVKDSAGLQKFLESKTFQESRSLMESDSFALGGGFGNRSLPPNNEYVPIMGGPFSVNQYLYDYLEAHAKCFQAKNHNPLAKEAIDVITFFTIGKGVRLNFTSPELQDGWDVFAKRNQFNEFIRMDSDTVTWAGEIGTHKTFFSDGFPAIKHIDMSTIWEIVTNPQDITEVYYYHQQFPTQYQMIYKPGDIAQEYVVNDIPANEVVHKKINSVPGEKRGRADLFNVLGWLKRFKDYYDAKITKAQMEESFVLKKKIKGSGADVDAFFNDPATTEVPNPGSVLIENEAIDTTYMTAESGATQGGDNVGESIRSIVATGMGLSPEYLGVGGKSGTRATAITKAEPAARKFEDRQQFFENYIREIADWWLVEAMKKKLIPATQVRPASMSNLKSALRKRKFLAVIKEATALLTLGNVKEPIDTSYEVTFPEIGTEDRSVKMKDIAQSEALEYISHERASTMSAQELGITSYDYEAEMEKRREEKEERATDPSYNGEPDPAKAMFSKIQAGAAAGGTGPDGKPKAGSTQDDQAYKNEKPA